jgi:hypothetical protein
MQALQQKAFVSGTAIQAQTRVAAKSARCAVVWNGEPFAVEIKSDAGGERRTIGLFEEVGYANRNRAEHNDPEGVKPRRGVEVR